MAVLEFEALLDDGVIHVPEAIAEQLAKGATLRVSIEPLEKSGMTPDEAWESILEFIRQRTLNAPPPEGKPYKFNRDELYDHLEKDDAPDGDH
jgi:hypothetical protein